MQAKEMRAGNIVGMDILNVFPPNFIAGIRPVILSKIRKEDFKPVLLFCPIPLTKQWLKKFPKGLKYPKHIKSVHDLQNWYYKENKKELEFKEK